MHSEDKVPKRCFLVQDQPNSFPIPPVIPPMRGMLPAGFCPEELFLQQELKNNHFRDKILEN